MTCSLRSAAITPLHRYCEAVRPSPVHRYFRPRGFSACALYGVFFVKEFVRAASRLSFVSFFVRSQSPFLRPDPRFADVVARRSCQGWPSRQPCIGLLLSRGSAVQRMFLSFVSFFVRSQSPFLRPDPRFADVVARRSCQGWPSR